MITFLTVVACLVTVINFIVICKKTKKLKELENRFNILEYTYSKFTLIFRDIIKRCDDNENDLLKLQKDVLLFMSTIENILIQRETNNENDIVKVLNKTDKQKLN